MQTEYSSNNAKTTSFIRLALAALVAASAVPSACVAFTPARLVQRKVGGSSLGMVLNQ
eukprot:CAMPEP_0116856440 /NCGR_PEP_ID=MMETSP0418-20121206/19913_1 /TAXON_ID=1158023 /ORGANISM="Astrosyne radiata, Strain 13vi08-1A" /LENGTH=57 /DNA_ID=CAMNT_0004489841 /DNA_START=51 /DNA_END=221 /DNA_ORIENTATION=-